MRRWLLDQRLKRSANSVADELFGVRRFVGFDVWMAPFAASHALRQQARIDRFINGQRVTRQAAADAVRALTWWILVEAGRSAGKTTQAAVGFADDVLPLPLERRERLAPNGDPIDVNGCHLRIVAILSGIDWSELYSAREGFGVLSAAWQSHLEFAFQAVLRDERTALDRVWAHVP